MIVCDTAVVFVPAKTPVKLEATDDGLDVWVAAVNPQVFQGETCKSKMLQQAWCKGTQLYANCCRTLAMVWPVLRVPGH